MNHQSNRSVFSSSKLDKCAILVAAVISTTVISCGPTRTIDGSHNNPFEVETGAADTALVRVLDSNYSDSVSALAGADRPGPRTISNIVVAQSEPMPNPRGASDFVWQWGQFLDHDIDLTEPEEPAEPAHIPVPLGDPFFDPDGT
ncbi:MAG: peroxidase family protein, partial [Myxococcota bacterium]